MSKKSLSILAPLIVTLALGSVACQKSGGGSVTPIAPREAQGELRNDFAVLIDVREPDETKDGMVAGALAFPLSKIEAGAPEWKEFLSKTPKSKKLIFYCASGGRAGKAAEFAAKDGFRAANAGGYDDLIEAGFAAKK